MPDPGAAGAYGDGARGDRVDGTVGWSTAAREPVIFVVVADPEPYQITDPRIARRAARQGPSLPAHPAGRRQRQARIAGPIRRRHARQTTGGMPSIPMVITARPHVRYQ